MLVTGVSIGTAASPFESELQTLSQLTYSSPNIPRALARAAQIRYSLGQWDVFFGISTYARSLFPQRPETEFVRLLETLALLRHCQWERATAAIVEAEHFAKTYREDWASLKALLQIDKTTLNSSEYGAENNNRDLISGRNLWPVSLEDMKRLGPWKMRKRVLILCNGSIK